MADRIESLECFLVQPRWVFLKITTADGLVGWGEPVVEGKGETVAAAVQELSDHLIGADPNRIEDLFQVMYRGSFYRGGPVLMSAISGIDQALWDIKGKRLGVPVYDLIGGAVRERVQAYCWVGGDEPAETADAARRLPLPHQHCALADQAVEHRRAGLSQALQQQSARHHTTCPVGE